MPAHQLSPKGQVQEIVFIMADKFPPLTERPVKDTLVLFDVDGTLTPARKVRNSSKRRALILDRFP